jgi:glycine/D-amino acid oxidase-like deaminating enzyme
MSTSVDGEREQSTYEADLLVIGAGIGGLATAGRAAERGSKVVVIEKEKAIGGSAILSGGFFWTLNSYDILREEIPKGDPEMGRVLIDRYEDAVAWVRSLGITMSDRVAPRPIPMGSGFLIDIKGLLD